MDLTESVRTYTQRKMGGPYGKGMTARAVASRSGGGITEGWLRRFLKGERDTLTVDQAEALALGLGVTFDELMAEAAKIRAGESPVRPPSEVEKAKREAFNASERRRKRGGRGESPRQQGGIPFAGH